MKKYFLSFSLGFLASTFLFLMLLSIIEIPEFIMTYEIECKRGLTT
jgi:hypothetical protein